MTKSLVIDGLSMNIHTETLTHFNEDWFGWPDAPGGEQFEAGFGAQYDADLDAGATWPEIVEQYGEDVALAQADMLYRDAEASWYRFMVA